jgi:conjugative transfer region protein (TIGR03748 family)
LAARDVQVGRYASLIAAPTEAQSNLLSKMVKVQFPSRVKTVGAAIQHLLRGSGYRLAGVSAADPARFDLLNFPLPTAHRSLGPMTIQDALETLGGPAFRLVEDPLHRLVSFESCGPREHLSSPKRISHRR